MTAIATHRHRHGHRPLAVCAALNALAAWAGAASLVGRGLSFGERLDHRLPFDSRPLAGIALATIVAMPLSMLTRAAWTGDRRTPLLAVAAGTLVMGWIVVQLAVLRAFSWFQPTYLVIGAALIWWGRTLDAGAARRSWRRR